jgi:hypothetical protein
VFGGKKTYQALKGCYERNFNLFKQIYAFETAHGQSGSSANLSALSETDRIREFERRLSIVRKTGSDIGSVTARTIDHWHRVGWYDLFYRRFVPISLSFISLIHSHDFQGGTATQQPLGPSKDVPPQRETPTASVAATTRRTKIPPQPWNPTLPSTSTTRPP